MTHPWVIAHRGASGCLPEHTLPAYALAIEQGADVIEPDLLPSADGRLYCRHDLYLSRSTDVATRSEYAARRRPGPEGREDWWITDFTSAELATLRATQPWPLRAHERDGVYRLPSFDQALDLLLLERRRRERPLLIYPEIKHPAHCEALGLDPTAALIRELRGRQLLGPQAPVLVQCFEAAPLARVREQAGVRVTLLSVDLPALDAHAVDGYGVSKQALQSADGAAFIAAAHARGRYVHAYTFRDDQLPPDQTAVEEALRAYAAGCDALFSDFPATALRARKRWQREGAAAPGLEVRAVSGADIAPYLPALAALRIRVFREWPYLYDGDLAYEAHYLATYSRSPRSLFVLAWDGAEIVGCSTGIPLSDETEACQAPFLAAGIAPSEVFYFGESVLDARYRGRGLGQRFFDEREAYAQTLGGFAYTAFCAVVRADDDPRRPPGHRPLDAFWRSRGYAPRPDLQAAFEWRELDEAAPSAKSMRFWLRAWR